MNGGTWAMLVLRKGAQTTCIAERLAKIINEIGYTEIIIKCDQEPAIKDLQSEIKREMWEELKKAAKD
eukprot:10403979-Karenia_brevis.AAC.1